jgi:uncharacterized protein
MKYLICIGHPAQFHLFKNIIAGLHKNGHETEVLITSKDILEDLCKQGDFEFKNILPRRKSGSIYSLATNFIKRCQIISKVIRSFKPDLLLGSEVTLPLLGKIWGVNSIVFSEDDAKIIPQYAKLAFPFANVILSPKVCNAGKWESKKIGYNGYQKLAYLHPNWFKPNKKKIETLLSSRYFLLRFAQLSAYHDTERGGITSEIAQELINILEPYGKIYITAERKLEPQFEKYRIQIDPVEIHNVLYHADLFIGDSQSMAVESAILGTPGIRFNDFAGEIGVLEELEHKYGLTFGIKTSKPDELYTKVRDLISSKDSESIFKTQHQRMLNEKIDVASFMVWFIENYPNSKLKMEQDSNYQYNFR